MIRRFLSLVILSAFLASCGNTPKETTSNETGSMKVEFASLAGNPTDYMGNTISVEGKVMHVCTHSGKMLFIVGENPDIRLCIQAGENMPKFPMELLGSTVVVEGTLTKAAGAKMGMKHEGALGSHTCETATALAAQVALADVIMEYKSHIVKE